MYLLPEGLAEEFQAFRDGGLVFLLSFEFEHEAGDAVIVEVEGVPEAAAVVGFGLHEDGVRGALFEFFVGILKEVSGIQENA